MKDANKISFAYQLDNIWIPPNGRPFWTTLNKKGNAIGGLYDEELDKYGLSEFKKFPLTGRREGAPIHKKPKK